MRIAHVSDCFLPRMGGIETQVAGLASQQAADGFQVTVFTCTEAGDFDDKDLPYRVRRSVFALPYQIPVDPRAPRRFYEAIRKEDFDVVHLHMGEVTPVVQALLWKLAKSGIPTVVTVHSVWSKQTTIPLYRQVGKLNPGLSSPIVWTGVSQMVTNLVAEVVGAENTAVLPNGVDVSAWRGTPIPHEEVRAVYAARFAPRKRIEPLIQIAHKVSQQLKNSEYNGQFQLVMAGDGPGREGADRLVQELGLTDVVSLTGRLTAEQLQELYRRSDVFVSPSIKEAASIAAAEAQAAGLALLSRAESGLGERIEPGVEGDISNSDQGLAQILVEWILQRDKLEEIKAYNFQNGTPLDWCKVMPQVYEIYRWAKARTL